MIIYGLEGLERQSQQIMPLAPSFLAASHKPETAFTSLDHADSSTSFLAARWAAPQVYPPGSFWLFCCLMWMGSWKEPPKRLFSFAQAPHSALFPWTHPLRGAIYSGRGLGIIMQFWGHRLAPGRCCRSCSSARCTSLMGWKQQMLYQKGPFSQPPRSPEQEKSPWFYGRGLRDPFTSPFIFPPAREKGPAVVFGSHSHILLPRTTTESAHISPRREVHESDC